MRGTLVNMGWFILVFLIGGSFGAFIGFCAGALMATGKHDDECAQCWSRAMRGVRPLDEFSEVDGR